MASVALTRCANSEWSSLPLPVVFLILDKLSTEPIDHYSFAAVCNEWGSLARDYHLTQRWHKNRALPMLLIPTTRSGTATGVVLYSVSQGKQVYRVSKNFEIDESWYGCGYGWFAIVGRKDLGRNPSYGPRKYSRSITLINPFSFQTKQRRIISLPCLIHDRVYKFAKDPIKVFLSDDPVLNPDKHAVVALFVCGKRVDFKRGVQGEWTRIDYNGYRKFNYGMFTDVIFYRDEIYLAGIDYLVSFNPADIKIEFTIHCGRIFPPRYTCRVYLVESVKGELWYVARVYGSSRYDGRFSTNRFIVYKLVFEGSTMRHVELKSIGDEALFLGDNQSISILSSQFPGCQPNSIYYTNDSPTLDLRGSSTCDMGIFNLKDETITKYSPELIHRANGIPAPVWITPVFNGL